MGKTKKASKKLISDLNFDLPKIEASASPLTSSKKEEVLVDSIFSKIKNHQLDESDSLIETLEPQGIFVQPPLLEDGATLVPDKKDEVLVGPLLEVVGHVEKSVEVNSDESVLSKAKASVLNSIARQGRLRR